MIHSFHVECCSLGADEVICTADEDIVERVKEITGKAGLTKAIDAAGGKSQLPEISKAHID